MRRNMIRTMPFAERAEELAAPALPPVVFVKYYDKGSTVMGAHQIADGLQARGWPARAIYARELGAVRQSIVVFIKTSRLDDLLLAKARGNRLVLDVQDTVVFKRRIKNRWLFDALILKNSRQLADFGRPGRPDRLIYHQWDPRYAPNRAPHDRLTVAYLGLRRSFDLWGRLPGVACVDAGYMEAAKGFNCHLSIRRRGREFLYKPNCKVSTAAACDANLITTRDVTAVDLLGEDYPYFCEPEPESILAAIERARASFGSSEWHQALDRLRAVRESTSLDRILDQYAGLFQALVPARPAQR
jgi:hypothetical protein